jgi:PAS domain-containing protein
LVKVSFEILKDLLATAEHATLVLTSDQKIAACNERARHLIAPELETLEGRALPDICTGRLLRFYNLVSSAMQSGDAVTNSELAMGDAACTMDVRRGDGFWVVRIRDVTEQLANLYKLRQAEAEKEEMWQLMMTALNGISVGIVVADAQGGIIYVNRFARKFIGDLMERSRLEDRASNMGLYEADGITLRAPHRQGIQRALKGETVMGERLVLRNELTERALNLHSNAAPFYDREGNIAGAVGWIYLLDKLDENAEPVRPEESAEIIDLMFRKNRE